jgi:hypothetical protein
MFPIYWSVIALAVALGVWFVVRAIGRVSFTRSAVLDEVRRTLRGGTVERTPGRGPQARGRLGQLEITVDLHHDSRRPHQSPTWRVLAVGPVRVDRPVELRTQGWPGWIDPWMELAETRRFPLGDGLAIETHSERAVPIDHPALQAVRNQAGSLGPGALHVRPDLMRAEIGFAIQPRDNRALFAWLQAMTEISEAATTRSHRDAGGRMVRGARVRVLDTNPA